MTDVQTFCLTFDFDAMSIWQANFNQRGPQAVSRGEYGARVGVPRILALLEKMNVPATFFTPAHTARTYPDLVRQIHDAGHEIANHGDFHETFTNLTPEKERHVLERAATALEEITGSRPVGFRAGSEINTSTIPLLIELGYEYDSTLVGDDFRLYRCRVGDYQEPDDSAYRFGVESSLVEFPVSALLNDFLYFEYFFAPYSKGQSDPEGVARIWQGELDYMLEHVSDGVFNLLLHPQSIGRGTRMVILEHLLGHARESGVVFRTMRDTARSWVAEHPVAAS